MGIIIKQLHDDLAKFYPITTIDAVIVGSVSSGNTPMEIDLSSYIDDNFKTDEDRGSFKMLVYNDSFTYIRIDVSKNSKYAIKKGGNNIIAGGMPVAYFPERTMVLKTITDDPYSKCEVIWDTNGVVRLVVVPNEITIVEDGEVKTETICTVNNISAIGLMIDGTPKETN